MPCRDYEPNDSANKKKLDNVTSLLCYVMTRLEDEAPKLARSMQMAKMRGATRLSIWWEEHKKVDAAEKEAELAERKREIIRKTAISKLTVEERKILKL